MIQLGFRSLVFMSTNSTLCNCKNTIIDCQNLYLRLVSVIVPFYTTYYGVYAHQLQLIHSLSHYKSVDAIFVYAYVNVAV